MFKVRTRTLTRSLFRPAATRLLLLAFGQKRTCGSAVLARCGIKVNFTWLNQTVCRKEEEFPVYIDYVAPMMERH